MGLFDGIKRRRAERDHEEDMLDYRDDLEEWQTATDRIDNWISIVRACIDGKTDQQFVDRNPQGFLLGKDEFPVAYITDTVLMQVVRGPGRYEGGYGGLSFPLFGGIRGHVGGQRGQYVQGAEAQKITDTGETMVTNVRVMFRGSVRSEEWKYSKMMSMEHAALGFTTFSMSGKSKTSAVGYGDENGPEIQFRLEIGAAFARDTLPVLLSQLEAEKSHHQEEKPVEPAPPTV